MVTPRTPPPVELSWRAAAWLGLALILVVSTAIWWRNHDILSDLYDYSSIIAAAGKVEAGLKPYVDFRSTMQSSTYLLNRAAEEVAGRSYRGLTLGGLGFILAGAVALFALWRRPLGTAGALAITAGVAWSGLGQHVVVFYNPVGILCLALVVAGVAREPRLWGAPRWDRLVVIAALVLGGMNKLNFQVLTLALAGVLVLEARAGGRLSGRDALASLGLLVAGGIAAPWTIELAWTGATPAQWFDNVVRLAGERIDYMGRLSDPTVYLGPAHDLHFHIPFKQLTAAGLLLLGLTGWLAWRTVRGQGATPARRLWLALYVAGAALGGVLLTITNVESIALTSLALLVASAGLWATTAGRETSPRWAWLIPAAGCLWALDGGTAAWRGSRILFGRADANRSVFVRLESAPPALRYLEGTRLDANLHRSLLLVVRELDRIKERSGSLRGILFGPTFEWLERAYPEAILRGMPVWYHVGTALREDDGDWLVAQLRQQHVDRVLTHPDWESWPETFRDYLHREFQVVPLGSVARMRERLGSEQFAAGAGSFRAGEPLALIERTGSNLHLGAMPPPEGFGLQTGPWGDFFGRDGSWRWEWPAGISIAEGTIVLHARAAGTGSMRLRARAVAGEGTAGDELWAAEAEVDAGRPWARLPFRITPYGRPVRLQVTAATVAPDDAWAAGVREVRISQTVEGSGTPPPSVIVADASRRVITNGGDEYWVRSDEAAGDVMPAWRRAPVEYWAHRDAGGGGTWRFLLETEPAQAKDGTPPVVMLLWYRSGRLELLSQQAIEPGPAREVAFQGWMPEPGGWMGVAVRPLESGKPFAMRVRTKGWNY